MTFCEDSNHDKVDNLRDENQTSVPEIVVLHQAKGETTTSAGENTQNVSDDMSSNRLLGMPHNQTNSLSTITKSSSSRSLRPRTKQVSYKGMQIDLDDSCDGPSFNVLPPQCFSAVVSDDTPWSYKKAMAYTSADMWKAACEK